MTAEDTNCAVPVTPPDVLHVCVEDTVAESADEFDIIHALITEMARIVIETEAFMPLYGIDCPERGQAFSRKAKQFASDMVFDKEVEVKQMDID